ncbi:MAG: hypothetical protein HZB61_05700 [Nitrospirae bacterium]|nr:hypothetical protein [Nitrospirota bacterium]
MLLRLLNKFISAHKEIIYREAALVKGFMQLLMKPVNTGIKWSKEERKLLISHIKHLSLYVPKLIIFLLPGGALIPFLAEILDRRKEKRNTKAKQ